MRLDDGTEITKAEHLAQVVGGHGTATMKADAKPVLTRLPVWSLAEVDAMAEMAHKSRNAMVIHLLDVGLEEVRKQMDDEAGQRLNELTTQRLVVMVADESDTENVEA